MPVRSAGEDDIVIDADSPRHHIDVVVFESPLVRVGRWRCPADHPHFVDSGPSSDALFAFPREGVWIQHEGRGRFVADANTVTYYNKGQRYRRHKLSARGDHCEWFAVAEDAIAEILAVHEPAAIDRPRSPFPFARGPSDPDSYLRQRMVYRHVSRESNPDRLFVEEAVLSLLGDITRLAYVNNAAAVRPRARRRPDAGLVEGARDVIARRFTDDLSLSDIAQAVGASVFHLARMFKARTGFSMHAYRNQLRLRLALERLRDPRVELTDIALDLGFSSHSHFTETFRRTFGTTPSAIRESL